MSSSTDSVTRVPERLSVEVMATRWRADDGGFAVLVTLTDAGEEVTVTGPLGHVNEGDQVEISGEWREHPKHGRQFHAMQVLLQEPVSGRAIRSYLAAIKHVGPAGARWLHERHGDEVLRVIDENPRARLAEVPGIGKRRLEAAVASWDDQGRIRAIRLFLETHGVPASAASRIQRAWGDGSLDTLRADPYALTEIEGIGFRTADELARALGTPPGDPGRLDAGVVHALSLAELDGHCFLPRAALLDRARDLLDHDVSDRLDVIAARGTIEIDGEDRVADARLAAIERRLARHAHELAVSEPTLRLRGAAPLRPDSGPLVPTVEQWAAVEHVLEHRLSILTGGPGTGKSSAMRALVDALREGRATVRLCAPTGKAARRLAEVAGAEATTIHRLLEWVPGVGFARDEEDPIPGADVLIVDEASMLDVRLADALLRAVGPGTHVLLVGDVDQLAPVGPGRVLEDLIGSGLVPTTRLTTIFRQAARSLIVRAAHAVNAGERPSTAVGEGDVRDFFLIERTDPAAVFREVCDLAAARLPSHYALDPVGGVQVLAPMHKGPVGIDAFNDALRARLNPDGRAIPGTSLREADRVLQTRNDHEHELMNGELGVIVGHDPEEGRVLLATDDGRRLSVPLAAAQTWRLAYAVSVHKSQGSQAPAIVVPLVRAHAVMLSRNLLYTAITRAERVCVVVGDPSAFDLASRRRDGTARQTRLAELVAGG